MDLLLSTKMTIPRTQLKLVERPHLVAQLDSGLRRRLTLVSAPAGFGKTTLVAAWADGLDVPVAWLSIDGGDNDPARFLSYLIAAFGHTETELSDHNLAFPNDAATSRQETVLTALINALNRVTDDRFLVLDDYHLITSAQVHSAVEFLLDHLPPNLHMVIATRADPPLPLARLRGRGHLVELRAADLRFTEAEAVAFLADVMGLTLRPQDVARLTRRTEGWIVGLQMAAISMRGREDTAAFVEAFAGSHRYVMDYLLEEVWEQQQPDVQQFLLGTSVLDSMSAPLCEALLGATGSAQTVLESLERANLFITALDERRVWFRYHRLFADLLRQRLQRQHPEWVVPLHSAASRWYAAQQMAAEAIDHALAAQDYDRAAGLIGQAAEATLARSELMTFLAWVGSLPEDAAVRWPALAIYVAWARFWSGQYGEDIDVWLDHLDALPEGQPGRTAALRAAVALYQGQMPELALQLQVAQTQLSEDDVLFGGMLSVLQALHRLDSDDPYGDGGFFMEVAQKNIALGNVMAATMTLSSLAELRLRQGRLNEAEDVYQQAVALARDAAGELLPVAGQALVGLGTVALMRCDIQRAAEHALKGMEIGSRVGEIFAVDGVLLLARVRRAEGDYDASMELLERARRFAVAFDATDIDDRMVALEFADHWVSAGHLPPVRQWAESEGLLPVEHAIDVGGTDTGPVSRIRKYELVTVARLLLAERHNTEAQLALEWSAERLEARGRVFFLAEVLALHALAQARLGDRAAALRSLQRALELSEPSGYLRGFASAGPELVPLLRQLSSAGEAPAFIARALQAAVGDATPERVPQPQHQAAHLSFMAESLAEREDAVLRLLPTHLSSSEIAERLVVAPSTVRTHIKNIYSKLQVHSRDEAVRRARDLELL